MADGSSQVLSLRLFRGPLDEPELQAVARLYGAVDAKYSSTGHCAQLFQRSPFGPTLHAFAADGDAYVGHYCLIPYDLEVDGQTVSAAKGEALCIDPAYRKTTIDGRPTSDAIMLGALELAAKENIEIAFAVAGAPHVVRLFERCGHEHHPFVVRELIVPPERALPLLKRLGVEWSRCIGTQACNKLPLRTVEFSTIRENFSLRTNAPSGHWQAKLTAETIEWFGPAPSNRFFQLGEALVWLTETHSDWELIASFSRRADPCQRRRLALELRAEATRRGIDRIRIPQVVGIEPEMLEAFAPLARRTVEREISWITKAERPLGSASPHAFLWSHF